MRARSSIAGAVLGLVVAVAASVGPASATPAVAHTVRAEAPLPSVAATGLSAGPGARSRPTPMWIHRTRHAFVASHWYGYEIGTDSWLTNKLEGGSWVGVGAGSFAAILGGGPPAWAVAAALTTFAGSLQLCQKANGWTYSYFVHGVVVCNPFLSAAPGQALPGPGFVPGLVAPAQRWSSQ